MNKYRIAGIILSFSCISLLAQLNLPVRKIGGTDYYYRQIKKKETIYGISKELGIPKEDIIKYNPSVAAGLKKDQIIYFPVNAYSPSKQRVESIRPTTNHEHLVKKGETLYGIAKMYGISVDGLLKANANIRTNLQAGATINIPINQMDTNGQTPYVVKPGDTLYRLSVNFNVELQELLAANPGLSPENFKSGMTILIPAPAKKAEEKPGTVFILEEVEKGDSFESLAAEYDIPENQLKEANPDMENLKRGALVSIPMTNSATEPRDTTSESSQTIYDKLHDEEISGSVNIAILLPMESGNPKPGKQALFYRDFYRGFLLALDELKYKNEIQLSVYDTNLLNLNQILAKQDVQNAHIIFAPGEEDLLSKIAGYGQSHDINVVNAFSINNDMYYKNDRFIQMNTPSSYMYSSVQDYIAKKFNGYQIVFLKENNDAKDKPLIEYVNLIDMPKQTILIDEANEFKYEHKTLFIPTTSSKSMLGKVKSFIENLTTESPSTYSLFGYPEWTLYHDYSKFFGKTGTYIFSRFDIDSDSGLSEKYNYWYGEKPINSLPQMCALGYDLCIFFVKEIAESHNDLNNGLAPMDGKQISINLTRSSSWGGFVNTASFIYHYKNNSIEKTVIK